MAPVDMTEARLRSTASLQVDSVLFGRLPPEIRRIIYAECWTSSGLKQHVFTRDGQLTQSPCLLVHDEVDARNAELQRMMCQNRRSSRSRSLILDEQWASRFSSTWHEHWRCEENMLSENAAEEPRPRRTLFLPILLTCKRTYLEALHSIYASVTLVFTHLDLAHRCLVASPLPMTTLLRSLSFSLTVPFYTLHQHRSYFTPSECPGPWPELCTKLSDLVRFASLREVVIRLDLSDDRYWWQVRERWVLSAVRGMLARCLTVQLPEVTHLEWAQPYQYMEGDRTLFKLERYPRLQWIAVEDGRIEPRVDPPRLSDTEDGTGSETRLQKATRGLRELVVGLKSA